MSQETYSFPDSIPHLPLNPLRPPLHLTEPTPHDAHPHLREPSPRAALCLGRQGPWAQRKAATQSEQRDAEGVRMVFVRRGKEEEAREGEEEGAGREGR